MPTFISLFSGCGGFDKGFVDQGFKCLGAYDNNPVAIDVYNDNIGNHGKLWDLSTGLLPDTFTEKVDIVLSGSPCQGFSTIGKRRIEDPRNRLLQIGGEIAVKLDSDYFIAENVMGSMSGDLKNYWNKLEQYMVENGYHIHFFKFDMVKFGLPQSRKRIIMIASKKNIIHFETPDLPMPSLKNVFKNLVGVANHEIENLKNGSIDYQISLKIKPGQKLSNVRGGERSIHTWNIPSVFGKIDLKEEKILLEIMSLRRKLRTRNYGDADPVDLEVLQNKFSYNISPTIKRLVEIGYLKNINNNKVDLVQTFNGKYHRLCYTRISPTVDTRFGNPKYFLHPEENRAITVREAARIQGFPDCFIFKGSKTEQYRMIGNAVPPNFSYWLASEINKHLIVNHE